MKFSVPDYDSPSDGSREESVQILNSQVRRYSVPSSDDDLFSDEEEGEISSKPKRDDNEKSPASTARAISGSQNAGATPNRPIQLWNEPTPQEELELLGPNESRLCDRPGRGDNTGTSHFNPIDLEGLPHQEGITPPDDSGDEVLIKLLTKQKQPLCNKSTSALRPTSAVETSFSSRISVERESTAEDLDGHESTGHDSESESDEEEDIEVDELQSRSASSDMRMTDSLHGNIGNSTDDFENVDEDDFESDEFFPVVHNTYRVRSSANVPAHRDPHTTFSHFHAHVGYDLDGETTVEHLRNNVTSTPGYMNRVSCSENMINVSQENYNDTHQVGQRPPSPSDAALAKKANAIDHPKPDWSFAGPPQVHSSAHEFPKFRELPQKPDSVRAEAGSPDLNPLLLSGFYDAYDPEWANRIQRDNSANIQPYPNPFLAQQLMRRYMNAGPCTPTESAFNNVQYTEYRSPPNLRDENADSHVVAPPQPLQKEPEGHSSRLNIADIVNPHADLSGPLKRKADEMSSDENEDQAIEESQHSMPETCEDVLPDAQPRDGPVNGEASLLEYSENTPKAPLQTMETQVNLELAGHPRKKVKTGSSATINLSKFVSGVCVGVVGVLAAFIATIPTSVEEEALQELAKST